MIERYKAAAERIRQTCADLDEIAGRARRAVAAMRRRVEEMDLLADSAALSLHDFYTGLERLFHHVAATIDAKVPTGAPWHRELLEQMVGEMPGLRPAVLSQASVQGIDEYLRFRHVVRNVYSFVFDPARIETLVDRLGSLLPRLREELEAFAGFLDKVSQDDE
ncbi:MAG: hypothetical protein HYY17_14025 [Planctomycetes bacterium]|nr:hypothetical protein [Planctomycetota bacterium]